MHSPEGLENTPINQVENWDEYGVDPDDPDEDFDNAGDEILDGQDILEENDDDKTGGKEQMQKELIEASTSSRGKNNKNELSLRNMPPNNWRSNLKSYRKHSKRTKCLNSQLVEIGTQSRFAVRNGERKVSTKKLAWAIGVLQMI